jgi:hypothetical protein
MLMPSLQISQPLAVGLMIKSITLSSRGGTKPSLSSWARRHRVVRKVEVTLPRHAAISFLDVYDHPPWPVSRTANSCRRYAVARLEWACSLARERDVAWSAEKLISSGGSLPGRRLLGNMIKAEFIFKSLALSLKGDEAE